MNANKIYNAAFPSLLLLAYLGAAALLITGPSLDTVKMIGYFSMMFVPIAVTQLMLSYGVITPEQFMQGIENAANDLLLIN